jgi:hypothetical protein
MAAPWLENLKNAFRGSHHPLGHTGASVAGQLGAAMLGPENPLGRLGATAAKIAQGAQMAKGTEKQKSVQDYIKELGNIITPDGQAGISSVASDNKGGLKIAYNPTDVTQPTGVQQSAGGSPVSTSVITPSTNPAGSPAAQTLASQVPAPVAGAMQGPQPAPPQMPMAQSQAAPQPMPATAPRPAGNPYLGMSPQQVLAMRQFNQQAGQGNIRTAGDLLRLREQMAGRQQRAPLVQAQIQQALANASATRQATNLAGRTVPVEIGGRQVNMTVGEMMQKYNIDQTNARAYAGIASDLLETQQKIAARAAEVKDINLSAEKRSEMAAEASRDVAKLSIQRAAMTAILSKGSSANETREKKFQDDIAILGSQILEDTDAKTIANDVPHFNMYSNGLVGFIIVDGEAVPVQLSKPLSELRKRAEAANVPLAEALKQIHYTQPTQR